MREVVRKAGDFLLFSLPAAGRYSIQQQKIVQSPSPVSQILQQSHFQNQVIFQYWFRRVVPHFALVSLLSMLLVCIFRGNLALLHPFILLTTELFCFLVVVLFIYRHHYHRELITHINASLNEFAAAGQKCNNGFNPRWIPDWDNIITQAIKAAVNSSLQQLPSDFFHSHQQKCFGLFAENGYNNYTLHEQNPLFESAQLLPVTKCRKQQLPAFTLMLVFYSIVKANNLTLENSANLPATFSALFGLDGQYLNKQWQVITGPRRNCSPRKRTEIQNRFEEAYTFLRSMGFDQGLRHVQDLEKKFT